MESKLDSFQLSKESLELTAVSRHVFMAAVCGEDRERRSRRIEMGRWEVVAEKDHSRPTNLS